MREDDAEDAADRREQQCLGEQLANDPRSRCTERSPYRELAVTRGALRKQQIGHVHAGDREEQNDGAGDCYQCGSDASRELVLQRIGNEAILKRGPLRPRILRQRRSGDRVELLDCALRIEVSSHATHEAQVMTPLATIEGKRRCRTSAATRSPPSDSGRSRTRRA